MMATPRPSLTKQVLILQPSPGESARVRAFLKALAEELGFSPERSFDIQLSVSEATANAIEHAHGSGEVRVEVKVLRGRLEVLVQGTGEFHLPAQAEGREHRGLGLPLMATLADHLALYSRAEGGTLVQLTFYLPGSQGPESSLPPSLVELLAEHNRLEEVLANASDSFLVFDEQWRLLYVNDRGAERMGRPRAELLGEVVWELRPEFRERKAYDEWHRAVREQQRVTFEDYDPPLDRWFEDRAFPFTGGLAVFSRDITVRKRAELKLQQGEERYRSLFQHMVEGFAYCRMVFEEEQPVDFEYLAVNDSFETLTGLREVVGKRVTEVIPDIRETNPTVFEIYGRVSLTGVPERYEDYFPALGVWLSVSVYSIERGTFVAVFENITERKRAEEALRESEERFRTMADAIPQLAWIARADGYIYWYNRRWYEYTGTTPDRDGGLGLAERARPRGASHGRGALADFHRHRATIRHGVPAARGRRGIPAVPHSRHAA